MNPNFLEILRLIFSKLQYTILFLLPCLLKRVQGYDTLLIAKFSLQVRLQELVFASGKTKAKKLGSTFLLIL